MRNDTVDQDDVDELDREIGSSGKSSRAAGPSKPASDAAPALWVSDENWIEAEIPARPWIAPGYLLRQALTLIVGAPSAGKSSLMLAFAAALARGEQYGRFRPARAFNVAVLNVEDDRDEQRRRLSGLLQRLGCKPSDLAGRLTLTGPTGTGTLLHFQPPDLMPSAAMQQLDQLIRDRRIDVLILDPFVELHGADENDNTAVRAVLAYFRALAVEHNIAIVILHHTRKGLATPGDPDIARGASAIIGAARIVLTVTPMTEQDALAFGMSADQRRHFFRLDGAKSNYAALDEAEWFQRLSRPLENGDTVAVAEPWSPPADFVTPEKQAAVEAAIERGTPAGPWSPKIEQRDRSIKLVMIEVGITTPTGQADLLAKLLSEGFVALEFRNNNRKWAMGLRAPSGKPAAEWRDQGLPL